MARGAEDLLLELFAIFVAAKRQSTYAIVVFMTAVTTLLAPPWLGNLFREMRGHDERPTVAHVQL
jgi:hypothetical protein